MRLHPLYRYVGPAEIAIAAREAPPGLVVASRDGLARAVRQLGGERVFTFVVDAGGGLRIAPRSSEHVACAGGGLVLAAGELTVSRDGRAIDDASNLSTGFCPRPDCLDGALADAIDAAGIARPAAFTSRFDLRRCTRCSARIVVKNGVLECPECDHALDAAWNFERARAHRGFAGAFRADVYVEAREHDEDRVGVAVEGDTLRFVLADGAGNSGRGGEAAERAVRLLGTEAPAARLAALDRALAEIGAEAAVVIADVRIGATLSLEASLAGDARLWARATDWCELSEGVPRKPRVGSGALASVRRAAHLDAVLCASDGLVGWPGPELDASLLAHDDAVYRLADAVRLRSGALPDDLSIVWVRPTSAHGT